MVRCATRSLKEHIRKLLQAIIYGGHIWDKPWNIVDRQRSSNEARGLERVVSTPCLSDIRRLPDITVSSLGAETA